MVAATCHSSVGRAVGVLVGVGGIGVAVTVGGGKGVGTSIRASGILTGQ